MLNLNYTLLSEGSNSKYTIPSYRNYGPSSPISEGYMITKLSEFNQVMREAQTELSNLVSLYSSPNSLISVSEAGVVSSIANTIRSIISKVIQAVKTIFSVIRSAISSVIKRINEKIDNAKYSKIEKMNTSERVKLLRQAIYNIPSDQIPQFKICDLTITKELLSNDFPNTKFIGSKLSKMTTDALDMYVYSYEKAAKDPSHYEADANAAESLADYLDSNSNTVLSGIFGNYQYDSTNVIDSAIEASKKAFGSTEFDTDFKLSTDLYLKACDSADSIKEVAKRLEKETKEVDAAEREINACLNKAMAVSNNMDKYLKQVDSYPNGIDLNAKFTEITKKMVYNLNRIMLFVQQSIAAEQTILRHKALRANQIYECSNAIKKTCHKLINIQLGTDEESTNEAYDPSDDVRDAEILQEQFESILCMTEEYWLENEFSEAITQYLTEANEPTGAIDPSASVADNQAKAASVQTNIGNTSTKVAGAPHMIDRFNSIFDKFRQTVLETANKLDTPFWNRNRGKVKELSFNTTTVSDWKNYNLPRFETRLNSIKYDDNAEYLNTDEGIQKEIFSKFGINDIKDARFSEDDTFSRKMLKVFYDGMVEKDKATPIGQAGFNRDQAFKFVDDIVRNGFNGTVMGNLKEDRKFINESYKMAQQNKQQTADKVADDKQAKANAANNNSPAQAAGTPASETGTAAQVQAQNNSAVDFDDFRFNLAEHFGLSTSEKVINIDEAQYNVGAEDRQNDQGGAGAGIREANARMNRYFKFMTFALSAKMTSAFAAYKQYMGLYKSAYKPAKNNNQTTNQQNQNNTEQQNQQNNQQENQGNK